MVVAQVKLRPGDSKAASVHEILGNPRELPP